MNTTTATESPYTATEYAQAMLYATENGYARSHFICANLAHFLLLTSGGSITEGDDGVFRKVSTGKPVLVFNPVTGTGVEP